MIVKQGLIHVYTGNGKGKTTAALGLGLRAAGAGFKVHMIQFMKGRRYHELNAIDEVSNFTFSQHGRDEFVSKEKPEQIDIDMAQEGFSYAKKLLKMKNHDLLILDEINVAVDFNLVSLQDVIVLLDEKPQHIELVCTGRYAHPDIIKRADVVTEMLEIRHPYHEGIEARVGIDF